MMAFVTGYLRLLSVGSKRNGEYTCCGRRGGIQKGLSVTMMCEERGSESRPYRIAVLPGDGLGPGLMEDTLRVLSAVGTYTDLHFSFEHGMFGEDAEKETGSLLPSTTVELCRRSDAVLKGVQGRVRGSTEHGTPSKDGHVLLAEALNLHVQLRPVVVYPQLESQSPLQPGLVHGLDVILVREISGGAMSFIDSGSVTDESSCKSEISYTQEQVARIASIAFEIAEARSGRLLNVDKADRMRVSAFFRKTLGDRIHSMAAGRSDIQLDNMYVDDFCRELMLRPSDFDVIVTTNLFGDVIAEIVAALAGPLRISPSAWFSASGTSVYGPADIYNPVAYPREAEASPIALIRSSSLLLRYALNEPAAADLLEKAIMRAFDEVEREGYPLREFADLVIAALAYMHQFEMVCNPTECGE